MGVVSVRSAADEGEPSRVKDDLCVKSKDDIFESKDDLGEKEWEDEDDITDSTTSRFERVERMLLAREVGG